MDVPFEWTRWLTLIGLGLYHGLNPGMGWLFAVALGLQERRGLAVVRALPPLALGHAASVALTVAVLAVGQRGLPESVLRPLLSALLITFGVWKLVRPRHPRWVGMRVGARDLLVWSFLMATAHGAGLMLLPVFLLRDGAPCHGAGCHAALATVARGWGSYLLAVGLHTAAMLVAAGTVALIVYYKLGLSLLRTSWLNLDYVWAAAMIGSGLLTLLL